MMRNRTILATLIPWFVIRTSYASIDLSNALDLLKKTGETVTSVPSAGPSGTPSLLPSRNPSEWPTAYPSFLPSPAPSINPTQLPTALPTSLPSESPSAFPTLGPSRSPTKQPTSTPSKSPTSFPSLLPTASPRFSFEIMVRLENAESQTSDSFLDNFKKVAKSCTPKNSSITTIQVISESIREKTLVTVFRIEGESSYNTRSSVEGIVMACMKSNHASLTTLGQGHEITSMTAEDVDKKSRARSSGLSHSEAAAIASAILSAAAIATVAYFIARHRRRRQSSREHHFDDDSYHETEIVTAPDFPNLIDEEDLFTLPSDHQSQQRSCNISLPSGLFDVDQGRDVPRVVGGSTENGNERIAETHSHSKRSDIEQSVRRSNSYDKYILETDESSHLSNGSSSYSVPGSLPISRSAMEHADNIRRDNMKTPTHTSQASVATEDIERACHAGRFNCFQPMLNIPETTRTAFKGQASSSTEKERSNSIKVNDLDEDAKHLEDQINFYPSMARIMRHKITKMNEKESEHTNEHEHGHEKGYEDDRELGEESIMFETMAMEDVLLGDEEFTITEESASNGVSSRIRKWENQQSKWLEI